MGERSRRRQQRPDRRFMGRQEDRTSKVAEEPEAQSQPEFRITKRQLDEIIYGKPVDGISKTTTKDRFTERERGTFLQSNGIRYRVTDLGSKRNTWASNVKSNSTRKAR